jgi:signal transduction histidine kinase
VVAAWGKLDIAARTGTTMTPEPHSIAGRVHRTARPARIAYDESDDPRTADARGAGIRSAVGTPIVVDGRLWGAIVVATTGSEPLSGDTELRLGEFTELIATAISNLQARSELAASRARVVAVTDEERRRVVRDLHDGAQQRLVHTIVTLKLAQQAFRDEDGKAESLLSEALEQAEQGNRELRELAHGILPAALTHGGLRAGVDAIVARLDLPVRVDLPAERLPAEIEASAYFIVAKH